MEVSVSKTLNSTLDANKTQIVLPILLIGMLQIKVQLALLPSMINCSEWHHELSETHGFMVFNEKHHRGYR